MSPTTDASGAAIAELATVLIDGPTRRFVESRPADRPESKIRRELINRAWRATTPDAAEPGSPDAAAVEQSDPARPVQLLVVDDPGNALEAVATLAARSTRPWLVLVGSPGPDPISLTGYRHLVFDGTYDLFLAAEHVDLAARLATLVGSTVGADASIQRWRATALEGWHARSSLSHAISANQELIAMRQTLSWRITRPLRVVRRRALAGQKR